MHVGCDSNWHEMVEVEAHFCCSVYIVKYHPDGSVESLKAWLVAKGYTQIYGVDYMKTFTPIARLNSVRIHIFLAVYRQWLNQLDIKNIFLHGNL